MYALTNCRIFTGSDVLDNHAVVIENGLIQNICLESDLSEGVKKHSLSGAYLTPGFIDLQLNGCGGVMFNNDITANTIRAMQLTNQKFGCTSFLPTLITSSNEDMKTAVNAIRDYQEKYQHQALGLHLEGPYLNIEKKGIHTPEFIRRSDDEMIDFIAKNADVITKITLAPELTSKEHIQQLVSAGIVVSIGHSNATYHQAREGFKAGITFATHLFNAMTSIAGRDPGVVGAVYDTPEIYAGIIPDGLHVDYANVRIAHKIKGEKLVLITDAIAPAGAEEIDSFIFVGKTVYYREGKCVDEKGTLGGATITMIEGIKNTVEKVGIALDEAVRMATLYPARAINMSHKLGAIKTGYIANLAIFDRDFEVKGTVINGEYLTN